MSCQCIVSAAVRWSACSRLASLRREAQPKLRFRFHCQQLSEPVVNLEQTNVTAATDIKRFIQWSEINMDFLRAGLKGLSLGGFKLDDNTANLVASFASGGLGLALDQISKTVLPPARKAPPPPRPAIPIKIVSTCFRIQYLSKVECHLSKFRALAAFLNNGVRWLLRNFRFLCKRYRNNLFSSYLLSSAYISMLYLKRGYCVFVSNLTLVVAFVFQYLTVSSR